MSSKAKYIFVTAESLLKDSNFEVGTLRGIREEKDYEWIVTAHMMTSITGRNPILITPLLTNNNFTQNSPGIFS